MGRSTFVGRALVAVLGGACGGADDHVRIVGLDAGASDAGTISAPEGSTGARDGGAGEPRRPVLTNADTPRPDVPGDGSGMATGDVWVATLSPAEDRALCEKLSAAVVEIGASTRSAACTVAGLEAASGRSGRCSEAREACLKEEQGNDAFDCDDPPYEGGCPGLAVRHLEACIASYRARAAQLGALTCRSNVDEAQQAVEASEAISPECQIVIDKCGS